MEPEKATETAPEDWVGYGRDDRLIRIYRDRLAGSLGSLNSRRVAEQFVQEKPLDAVAWLETTRMRLLGAKAEQALTDLYVEFGALGAVTARSQLETAKVRRKAVRDFIDWSGWTPGDPVAATRLLGDGPQPGLRLLLDQAGITIKGIRQTRLTALARVLSDGVAAGTSSRGIAATIRAKFSKDRYWANMVARTEGRRAVTAAAVDTYRAANVNLVEWALAWGNACPICKGYAALGPVPLEEGFDGLSGPPAHPNCLCVVYPVVQPDPTFNG